MQTAQLQLTNIFGDLPLHERKTIKCYLEHTVQDNDDMVDYICEFYLAKPRGSIYEVEMAWSTYENSERAGLNIFISSTRKLMEQFPD